MAPSPPLRRAAAGDPDLFARHILCRPPRPYQAEVARAVLTSLRYSRGDTITVLMARQMGKNETSAMIEAYLLNLFKERGGNIIKAAPTLRPQAVRSKQRLLRLLDNPANREEWDQDGTEVVLGRAHAQFLSAAPTANIVGGTADLLLEMDEAQDLDEEKVERDLLPMAASTNATRVLYGTALTTETPLEAAKQRNLELEARDGRRRHFEFDWQVLAALNPHYRRFVEGEIARLGLQHPTIQTQYLLRPIDDAGKMFGRAVRELLEGAHPSLERGGEGEAYVAGVDVAGQDAALPAGILVGRDGAERDSTVVTVARVRWTGEHEPAAEVVYQEAWTGAAMTTAHHALAQLLGETFPCMRVAIDATGIGAGPAAWLGERLGRARVEAFVFTAPGKSRLGFNLLAMAGTGRVRLYRPVDEEARRHRGRMDREVERARYELRGTEQLAFFVPAREGHDDYLMSLALCAWAAAASPPPPLSETIPPAIDRHGRVQAEQFDGEDDAGAPRGARRWDEVY